MKILVTGGAGYVGASLIEYLVKNTEHEITSLDNYISGSKNNHILNKNVNYIEGNTWDGYEIFKDTSFDLVFHFGEFSRIHISFEKIQMLYKSILQGTPVILELVRKWNAKLIYSATSSGLNNKENLSPYTWMKNKMCELIKNYAKWYNINYQICYFFNVYGGTREISSGEYSTVIGIFTKQYLNNEKLTIVKPGTQERCFTNINDIIDGLVKVMEITENNEWYLSHEESYSILDIVKMFGCEFKYIEERQGERYMYPFKKNTNWKAKISLKDYIYELKLRNKSC